MLHPMHRGWLAWSFLLLMAMPAWSQAEARRATLHVRLPADAMLMVDGKATTQTGALRHFYSPPLQPGKNYYYTFEWTYKKDGKSLRGERKIYFHAGDDLDIVLSEKDETPDKANKRPAGKDDESTEKSSASKKPAKKGDVNWVASPPEVVDKMLEMAKIKKDDVVYDLGCGDGRIVIAAAKKYGCKAVGFEIDPKYVQKARDRVKAEGVQDLVEIREADLFKVNLEPASVVTMYLLSHLNLRLVPQLQKLKPGSRIVSHDFEIEGYPPQKTASVKVQEDGLEHKVYLWEAPLKKE